jgi:hypothetical protein
VKPDGSRIFIAWYDRRNDPSSNSLIQTYGVFAKLPITNASQFATNFPISTVMFPPAFTGTNKVDGTYDPTYPPNFNDDDPNNCFFIDPDKGCKMFCGIYAGHMGDYDVAASDNDYVYYTWGDNRNTCVFHGQTRPEANVRFVRISWPR